MGSLILVLLLLVATPRLVVAYELKTHRRISTEAATLSVLSSSCSPAPCRTPLMNLTKTLGGPGAQLPTDIGRTLADAAVAEDDDKRPANHFFNPLTGEGFTHLLGGQPAPLWALGAIVDNHGDVVVDESADIFEEPRPSFRSARSGLYEALTSPAAVSRRKSALTMVRLLGHVIHVLQDMAQPQHVRDDNHFALPLPPHSPFRFEHPSAYEHWVEDNLNNIDTLLEPYPVVQLPRPQDYWTIFYNKNITDFPTDVAVRANVRVRALCHPDPQTALISAICRWPSSSPPVGRG